MISTVSNAIKSLQLWMEKTDYSSFDHYDFLSTGMGVFSKRLFQTNKLAGLPLVSLITLLDIYAPGTRKWFAKQQRSAEAIPLIATSYFRLYKLYGDISYLYQGRHLLNWLRDVSSPTHHGLGWGLHFDWQAEEFIPKGTPCVTVSAYSTEAFLEGYRLTGEKSYLDTAIKTSQFVVHDLNQRGKQGEIAFSYSPVDHRYVINANSYAARIMMETLEYQDSLKQRDLIMEVITYILNQQNSDGSWYYHDKTDVPPEKNFIDSFHTCFILGNLFFLWKWLKDQKLEDAIIKGYDYFVKNFIMDDYSVRLYHYYPIPTGVKVDIRACAEAIYCCALLSELIPDALELSKRIAQWTILSMQDRSGYFYFRIYITHKHKMPYMRWGEAPMFNALTFLLTKITDGARQ